MKVTLACVAGAACIAALPMEFEEYVGTYNKNYESEEYELRRKNFAASLNEIDEINSKNLTWTAGINEFSDMSWEEFAENYIITKPQDCSATAFNYVMSGEANPPTSVDWRKKGVVTHVKNQGSCGSCWTFSTTGAVESATAIATGVLPILSEQQLIDCAEAFDNHGCNGGLPSHAFQYIMYNGGLDTESGYPYKAKDGKCQFAKSSVGATLKTEVNITQGSDDELADALAKHGPVSVAYEVASDFKNYKSGVYTSTVCKSGPKDVNHAVLAVGYDVTKDGQEYYIVKNSWGTTFGIDGYFNIARGVNMCGISTCASFPIA